MHGAYVKLGPSSIAGVGVFALINIPAGVDPFAAPNEHLSGQERSLTLTGDELKRCPAAVVEHVLNFHDSCHNHSIGGTICPPSIDVNARGLVSMDTSWYLNHSEMANVELDTNGRAAGGFFPFKTKRPVQAGEELLLDYRKALPGVYAQIQGQQTRASLQSERVAGDG